MSRTASVKEPLAAEARIATSPVIGELDRIADQIEQNLRDAAFVAVRPRQVRRQLGLKREVLSGGQRLDGAQHTSCTTSLIE